MNHPIKQASMLDLAKYQKSLYSHPWLCFLFLELTEWKTAIGNMVKSRKELRKEQIWKERSSVTPTEQTHLLCTRSPGMQGENDRRNTKQVMGRTEW